MPLSKGNGDEKLRTVNKSILLVNRGISLIKVYLDDMTVKKKKTN